MIVISYIVPILLKFFPLKVMHFLFSLSDIFDFVELAVISTLHISSAIHFIDFYYIPSLYFQKQPPHPPKPPNPSIFIEPNRRLYPVSSFIDFK